MAEDDDRQTDFGSILSAMASASPPMHRHRDRIHALMHHFARRQIPLEVVADEKHLRLSMGTLKRYARELGLAFPDYVPMAFRNQRPPAEP